MNEDELAVELTRQIDILIQISSPTKLVMLALDGIIPRAKMHSKRTQNFLNAKRYDKILELKECEDVKEKSLQNNINFGVNITGTRFITKLEECIEEFVIKKLQSMKDVKFLIDGSKVDGEASQKICEFIRSQKCEDCYITHCNYGTDQKLIFMALALHEPSFYILEQNEDEKYKYMSIQILREYFDFEFKYLNLPFEYNLERVIDDIVLISFMLGSDFLPKIQGIEISDEAFDNLLYIYKRMLPFLQGYLTDNGELSLLRADIFIRSIGDIEQTILRNKERNIKLKNSQNVDTDFSDQFFEQIAKRQIELGQLKLDETKESDHSVFKQKTEQEIQQEADFKQLQELSALDSLDSVNKDEDMKLTQQMEVYLSKEKVKQISMKVLSNQRSAYENIIEDYSKYYERYAEGLSANLSFTFPQQENQIDEEVDESFNEFNKLTTSNKENLFLEKVNEAFKQVELNQEIVTSIGKNNYKTEYYMKLFKIEFTDSPLFKLKIQKSYIEGIAWLLSYYYKGCVSWQWYYPFLHAPFASDLDGIEKFEIKFDLLPPVSLYEYYFSVFSQQQISLLPESLQNLINENSDLFDHYPNYNDLKKLNGATILPFVDYDRIRQQIEKQNPQKIQETLEKCILFLNIKNDHEELQNNLQLKHDNIQGEINVSIDHVRQNILKTEFQKPELNQNLKQICYPFSQILQIQDYEEIDVKYYENSKEARLIERILASKQDKFDKSNRGLIKMHQNQSSSIKPFQKQFHQQNKFQQQKHHGAINKLRPFQQQYPTIQPQKFPSHQKMTFNYPQNYYQRPPIAGQTGYNTFNPPMNPMMGLRMPPQQFNPYQQKNQPYHYPTYNQPQIGQYQQFQQQAPMNQQQIQNPLLQNPLLNPPTLLQVRPNPFQNAPQDMQYQGPNKFRHY